MVRRGRLVEQIVAAAGQMETDLLLLGRARRWGWERLLARNRVRAIVREASCPALVIPEVFATRHGPGLREGVVVIGRRVLVPVDGSELSREAVRWGAALAEPAEGRLIVFHVAGLHSEGQGSAAIGPEIFRAVTAEALEQRLWAWAQAIVPSMAQVHALQETGVAGWDVLVAVAARERCDLIVVCSHTVQAWRRLLGGCLAEQLVAGSSCPVLCLPEGSVKQASAAARIAQTP
jgi:nucleotide-binding universal stress UspA family protein